MTAFLFHRVRSFFWTAFYRATWRAFFTSLGPGAKFEGWIDLPQRFGRIRLGSDVHIGRGVEFSVVGVSELIVGPGTFIGRGTVISVHRRVKIGAHVLIGEYVSIHDNNHRFDDQNLTIRHQAFDSQALDIGDDCWLGAKSTVVMGGGLGRRCVLGAGAVLTRPLGDYIVAVGVPARPMEALAPVV